MSISIKNLILPLIIGCVALTFVFSQNGFLNVQTDTPVYTDQIRYFDGEIQPTENTKLRSFKPFYGIVGSFLTPFLSPSEAILAINIIFYFGLIISTFFFLKLLGFSEFYSSIGASWVATGYPVLKYGLALLTDISGWFFAGASLVIFLLAIKQEKIKLFILASVVAFVGSLCKETGILGLLFAGMYLTTLFLFERKVLYIKQLCAVAIPFIILQGLLIYILFTTQANGVSFFDWFLFNKNGVGYGLHTLYYFSFTEMATFSVLWVYGLYSVYVVGKNLSSFPKKKVITGVCLFLAVLPPLIWPVFLTRVLYIGYLFIIPAALLGLSFWEENNKEKKVLYKTFLVLPIIVSVSLLLVANGGSLFSLINQNGY